MIDDSLALRLDDAWPEGEIWFPSLDVRPWGPRLRFCAPTSEMEAFYKETSSQWRPFLLSGSGDFHHLSALYLRKITEPFVLISFDNHPDWDIRPPRWCAGSWISRALENPLLQSVHVWGPGSFECWGLWPLFANNREIRRGRLHAYPWVDHRPAGKRAHRGAITRKNWRERFEKFAAQIGEHPIYVTIDFDSLRYEDAVTNWEPGRFTTDDIVWAVRTLRGQCRFAGGDICGAWSTERYARWTQRFCGTVDHPRLERPDTALASARNLQTLRALWPALTGK